MHHSLPLITTIALAFALALILGFAAARLKLPPLVGYLLAGIAIGPFTPGIYADVEIALELAEIGVMLLMFGVGLHFSMSDLLKVRKIAIPGAVVQILVATVLGCSVAMMWDWPPGSAVIFGISLSVASTVVLIRALEELKAMSSINGHIAVGWLLVEDLAMLIVLVVLPPFSHWLGGTVAVADAGRPIWWVLGLTTLKVSTFIILMMLLGRRLFPRLLWEVARTGSRELFTLCVVAAAICIAYGAAKLFGVSFALGAFFAGMILRESAFSHRAAEESLPLRDAFAVLFFVSVGMLFDPSVLTEQPLRILTVVAIIVVGKSIAAFIIVLMFRYSLYTALIVSVSLAQIGEFSIILAQLATRFNVLPVDGQSYILAGALITIAINPLLFKLIDPLQKWLGSHFKLMGVFDRSSDPLAELPTVTHEKYLSGQVVLVGYGQVGALILDLLSEKSIPVVVVDDNRESIEDLRKEGVPAVYGDAAEPFVLIQAHIVNASLLITAISDTIEVRQMIRCARTLNPNIEIVIRTHDEEEADMLQKEITGKVFFAEEEIARNMGAYVLHRFGK